MDLLWLALGTMAFSALQFSCSKLSSPLLRSGAPWAFAVLAALAVAVFLPTEDHRWIYGWPALNSGYLLRTGSVLCIPAFEATLVARWFLRKPRTFRDFMLRSSASTFAVWAFTVVVLSIVTTGS